MTRQGLVLLRVAATLAHALPGIRLRLRVGDETVATVTRHARGPGVQISPCEFRMAVGHANAAIGCGAPPCFLGLRPGADLAIDVGLPAHSGILPGGIYHLTGDGQEMHAIATSLSLRRCLQLLPHSPPTGSQLHLHHDVVTEVTTLHTVGPTDQGSQERRRQLEEALAALVADEVIDGLADRRGRSR